MFVGYPHGKKGWKLYDLEQNTFLSSKGILFTRIFSLLLMIVWDLMKAHPRQQKMNGVVVLVNTSVRIAKYEKNHYMKICILRQFLSHFTVVLTTTKVIM